MEHRSFWWLLFVGLLVTLGALVEAGRRLRVRTEQREGPSVEKGLGAVEAAVFSLLGLLLAFTFTSAAGRFDGRRQLAIDESNALGTAYLRFDLVPPELRPALRSRFREYVDARLAGYRALPHAATARAHFKRATEMQDPLWQASVEACAQAGDSRAAIVLLPALNSAFDLAATRSAVFLLHPPPVVFLLLLVLAMLCSAIAGWSMGATPIRRRLHMFSFIASLAVTLYLTVELELPRYGLVTVDNFDSVLADARARMR